MHTQTHKARRFSSADLLLRLRVRYWMAQLNANPARFFIFEVGCAALQIGQHS